MRQRLRPARRRALNQAAMQPADATRHLIPRVEEVVQAGQRGAKDAA